MSNRMFRVGALVPSSNTVLEADLHRSLDSSRYVVVTSRMRLLEASPEGEAEMINRHAVPALQDVLTAQPHAIVFGCTSGEAVVASRESPFASLQRDAGVPFLGVFSTCVKAMTEAGYLRVRLRSPFTDEINGELEKQLAARGIFTTSTRGMGISENFGLAAASPEEIADFVLTGQEGADAIFVPCTNFRALEALPMIEQQAGIPVVTSTSALVARIQAIAVPAMSAVEAVA